jgi:hypothetical protein
LMDDLQSRLANRGQLTSAGHKAYLDAVEGAFGGDIDYAMLVRLFGPAPDSSKGRYTPQSALAFARPELRAIPIRSTSARPMRNGTISICGCKCAAFRG